MGSLIIQDDKGRIQQIKMERGVYTIGRREDNDIAIADVFISRYHARIEEKEGAYQIVDLGSSYGTIVNNRKIDGVHKMEFGDIIKIGNSTITFVEEGQIEIPKDVVAPPDETKTVGRLNTIEDEIRALGGIIQGGSGDSGADVEKKISAVKRMLQESKDSVIELERSAQIASTLYEVGKAINFVFDLNLLLNLIMDLALQVMKAERGFIMIMNEQTGELAMRVARNMERGGWDDVEKISRSIVYEVFRGGAPVLTDNAQDDERFREQESVIMHGIRAVMCVPLKTKELKTIGVIYVDSQRPTWLFSDTGLSFLTAFANQAAIAIENAELYEKITRAERIRTNLQRYLSQPLVEKIMKEKEGLGLGGEQKIVTVLFADIRGFTPMVEKMRPADVVELLNSYFTLQTEEIFREGGTLDKYIGDCIMAIFGAPFEYEDHALRAVKAALGMRRGLEQFKADWQGKGAAWDKIIGGFEVGIGINTGPVIVGNIGSEKRMEYTVISDAVNTASRLEGAAKRGQILISQGTYTAVQDHVKVNSLPPIQVKGKSEKLQTYEVLGMKEGKT